MDRKEIVDKMSVLYYQPSIISSRMNRVRIQVTSVTEAGLVTRVRYKQIISLQSKRQPQHLIL